MGSSKKLQLVSIIIPTLNCASLLEDCLLSIKKQSYTSFEIIVVDDHSNDNTIDVAKKYDAQVYTYGSGQRIPFGSRFATALQYNLGVRNSKGELLYLVDSDMRLQPSTIQQCVELIDRGAEAVLVPERSTGENFWARCKALDKLGYFGDYLESPRFFTRAAWGRLQGLEHDVGAFVDWDWTDRLRSCGLPIARIDSYVIHYEGRLSLGKLIRKKFVYGKSLPTYLRRRRPQRDAKTFLLRLTPFRLLQYLIRMERPSPTTFFGMMFMKSCELLALLFGMSRAILLSSD